MRIVHNRVGDTPRAAPERAVVDGVEARGGVHPRRLLPAPGSKPLRRSPIKFGETSTPRETRHGTPERASEASYRDPVQRGKPPSEVPLRFDCSRSTATALGRDRGAPPRVDSP